MNKAVEVFSEIPRRYNCAQSVAAGLEREDLVPALASCGGGKAPEGRCGALHAAMLIAGESKAGEIRAKFVTAAGSEFCRVLKQELKVPCAKCVETAAALAEAGTATI